ncbi:Mis12 protein-domain-containing protein [Crassisporium funariophilum]|nr:Mis12 protein-domain-containing protein [Crassisporium funariophilum]
MPPNSQGQTTATGVTQTVAPLLLCEALGFSPQLLLDDIINVANNAVQDGVNGMEEFLQKWADERVARAELSQENVDATTHEVEQGLVAFQTLLEHHTDIAFDFFEAWCLRNIFMIPQDLPIVLPHQEGLDLTINPEKEQELMDEVEELRKRLDGQRKLNRLLSRAIRVASRQQTQAESRLAQLSSLSTPDGSLLDTLHTLPPKFLAMYKTLSSLPPLDPSFFAPVDLTQPGQRQWETSKTGYVNWAVGRLLVKSEAGDRMGLKAVDKVERDTQEIGTGEDLRGALDAVGVVKHELSLLASKKDEYGQDDSRMEE